MKKLYQTNTFVTNTSKWLKTKCFFFLSKAIVQQERPKKYKEAQKKGCSIIKADPHGRAYAEKLVDKLTKKLT